MQQFQSVLPSDMSVPKSFRIRKPRRQRTT